MAQQVPRQIISKNLVRNDGVFLCPYRGKSSLSAAKWRNRRHARSSVKTSSEMTGFFLCPYLPGVKSLFNTLNCSTASHGFSTTWICLKTSAQLPSNIIPIHPDHPILWRIEVRGLAFLILRTDLVKHP